MTNQQPLKTGLLNIDLILEKAKIKEGDAVGDLGCGKNGYFAFLAADHVGHRGLVYAVDVLKHNLELIAAEAKERHLSQIKTVWSDIELWQATDIEPNSLDTVFLVNVLHESGKPTDILKEGARLLKKSGRLVVVDWKKVASPFGPEQKLRLDPDLIINFANKVGLVKEEEFAAGKYHFGVIFNKI